MHFVSDNTMHLDDTAWVIMRELARLKYECVTPLLPRALLGGAWARPAPAAGAIHPAPL